MDRFASMIFLTAVVLSCPQAAQAVPGDGTVQPFQCDRNVTAKVVKLTSPTDKENSVDRKGRVVQCVSSGNRAGSCGLNVRTKKVDYFTYIHILYKGAPNAAKFVSTRFCVTKNNQKFEVTKPLSEYRKTDVGGGWVHSEADAWDEIRKASWGDIDRVAIVLSSENHPTNITFGKIVIFSGNKSVEPTDLNKFTEGCSGAGPCPTDEDLRPARKR
jgi:hypothetical protein